MIKIGTHYYEVDELRFRYSFLIILFLLGGCNKVLFISLDDHLMESLATRKDTQAVLDAELHVSIDNTSDCEKVRPAVSKIVREFFRSADGGVCDTTGLSIKTNIALLSVKNGQTLKEAVDGLSVEKGVFFLLAAPTGKSLVGITPTVVLPRLDALNERLMDALPGYRSDVVVDASDGSAFAIMIDLKNTSKQPLLVRATSAYVNGAPFPVAAMVLITPGGTTRFSLSEIQKTYMFSHGVASAPMIEAISGRLPGDSKDRDDCR